MSLNELTEYLGISQINIDPFVAGVLTIGFIYGAYFTETFRGAFMIVPKGQIEAAVAYGFLLGKYFGLFISANDAFCLAGYRE